MTSLALIMPRPLILINGIHDTGAGFQIDDMRAQFPVLEAALRASGRRRQTARSTWGHGYFPCQREVIRPGSGAG